VKQKKELMDNRKEATGLAPWSVTYCESLGHVREGNGTHGTIKNYEEIELIDGDSE